MDQVRATDGWEDIVEVAIRQGDCCPAGPAGPPELTIAESITSADQY